MALIEITREDTTEDVRVHTLCNALRPEDPLRYCASVSLRRPAQDVDAPSPRLLLDTLAGPRPGTLRPFYSIRYVLRWLLGGSKIHPEYTPREIAAWALGHVTLPPQDRAEAILALMNALRGGRGRKAAIYGVNAARGWLRGWLFFTALSAALIVLFDNHMDYAGRYTLATLIIRIFLASAVAATLFSPLFVAITLQQTNRHRDRMQAAAARSLGQLAAPEGLSALADAFRDRPGNVRSAVVTALTPDWYGRMPVGTTRDVCRALRCMSLPGPTRLLLVHALQVVGDGSGVRDVEALLAGPQPLYADAHGIEEHLQTLLPLLRERLRLEQDDALLLRGSQQTATTQEQLLRAVQGDETVP